MPARLFCGIALQDPEQWPETLRHDIEQLVATLQFHLVHLADLVSAYTAGSIIFAATDGQLDQDNANLFWDNTNNRLGILTAVPAVPFHLAVAGGNGSKAYLGNGTAYTGSSYGEVLELAGNLTFNNVASTRAIYFGSGSAGASGGILGFGRKDSATIGFSLTEGASDTMDAYSDRLGAGVAPSGNGKLQAKVGNQTTTIAKGGGKIFDFIANSTVATNGAGFISMYQASLTGSALNTNGDTLSIHFAGTFVQDTIGSETHQLQIGLGANLIAMTPQISTVNAAQKWVCDVTMIRATSSTVRVSTLFSHGVAAATATTYANEGTLTGYTFTNAQVIDLQGEVASGISGDGTITGTSGYVEWKSAA